MAESFSFEEASKPIASGPESFSFEEASTLDVPSNKPKLEVTQLGAGAASAGEAALATPPALYGAGVGARFGGAVGGVPGAVVGGITGAVVTGIAAQYGITSIEGAIDSVFGTNIVETRQKQQKQYPLTSLVGQVAGGGVGPGSTFGLAKEAINIGGRQIGKFGQAGIGAGIGVGVGAAQRAATGGNVFDIPAIAADIVSGGATRTTALGQKIIGAGERLVPPKPGIDPKQDAAYKAQTELEFAQIEKQIKEKEKTNIKGAVFREKDTGKIIDSGKKHDEELKKNPNLEAGFIDGRGEFLTRKEAEERAFKTGQLDTIDERFAPEEGLHSGDIFRKEDSLYRRLTDIQNKIDEAETTPGKYTPEELVNLKDNKSILKDKMTIEKLKSIENPVLRRMAIEAGTDDVAMHGGNIQTVGALVSHLKNKFGTNHYISNMLDVLSNVDPNMTVNALPTDAFRHYAEMNGFSKKTPAYWNEQGIWLEEGRGTNAIIAAHEIGHAATAMRIEQIRALPVDHPEAIRLKKLVSNIEDILTDVKSKVDLDKLTLSSRDKLEYALSNIHEFISDGVFNPSVMQQLLAIDRVAPKLGFVDKILKAVSDFFNLNPKQYTALHDLIESVSKLTEADVPKNLDPPGLFTLGSRESDDIQKDLGKEGISAAHDSPHRFSGDFDWIQNVGKGQGAAAKGVGTYLSSGDDVHHNYKKEFTDKIEEQRADAEGYKLKFGLFDTQTITKTKDYFAFKVWRTIKQHESLFNYRKNRKNTREDAIASVKQDLKDLIKSNDYLDSDVVLRAYYDKQLQEINKRRWLKAYEYVRPKSEQYQGDISPTYHVTINANPDHIMSWDKPLKEQSEYVQQKLNSFIDPDSYAPIKWEKGADRKVLGYPNRKGETLKTYVRGVKEPVEILQVGFDGAVDDARTYMIKIPLSLSDKYYNTGEVFGSVKEAQAEFAAMHKESFGSAATPETTVGQLYNSMVRDFEATAKREGKGDISEREAQIKTTLQLLNKGIVGHRFNSAGGQNAKYPNYVIFKDSVIETNAVTFRDKPKQPIGKAASPESESIGDTSIIKEAYAKLKTWNKDREQKIINDHTNDYGTIVNDKELKSDLDRLKTESLFEYKRIKNDLLENKNRKLFSELKENEVVHYTPEENIPSILENGLDTTKSPKFSFGNDPTGKMGPEGTYYFTKDIVQWAFHGKERTGMSRVKATLKSNLNILTIDSIDAARKAGFNKDNVSDSISSAKNNGYDGVRFKYSKEGWRSDYDYRQWTGGSGKDDFLIFNKDSFVSNEGGSPKLTRGSSPESESIGANYDRERDALKQRKEDRIKIQTLYKEVDDLSDKLEKIEAEPVTTLKEAANKNYRRLNAVKEWKEKLEELHTATNFDPNPTIASLGGRLAGLEAEQAITKASIPSKGASAKDPSIVAASKSIDPNSIANEAEFQGHVESIYLTEGREAALEFFTTWKQHKAKTAIPVPSNTSELADAFHKINVWESADSAEFRVKHETNTNEGVTSELREQLFRAREGEIPMTPELKALEEKILASGDKEIVALLKKARKLTGDERALREFETGQARYRVFSPRDRTWKDFWDTKNPLGDKVAEEASGSRERSVFQLDDGKVIQLKRNEKTGATAISIWKDNKQRLWTTVQMGDKRLSAGDTIPGTRFKITDGQVHNIEANTPFRYLKDAEATQYMKLIELRKMTRDLELIDNLKQSNFFDAGRSPDTPLHEIPKDYVVPNNIDKIPQLRGWMFDPKTAAVIEDFAKVWDNNLLIKLSSQLIKNMMLNPFPHMMNEVAHLWNLRGLSGWVLPNRIADLAVTGKRAWTDVASQSPFYREIMREGGTALGADPRNNAYWDQIGKDSVTHMVENVPGIKNMLKGIGYTTVDFYNAWSKNSSKAMWFTRDVMYTQAVHEVMDLAKRRGEPIKVKEAIRRVEEHMPNYRIPTEVAGSRMLSKVLQNPNVSIFSRYHYGMLKSLGNIIKEVDPRNLKSVEGRREFRQGVDSALAAAVAMTIVYPLLDILAEKVFGPDSKLRRAGPFHLIHAVEDVVSGEKDPSALIWPIYTFNPALLTLAQLVFNKVLFSGKPVYYPNDSAEVIAGDVGSYLAKSVPQISTGIRAQEEGGAVSAIAKQFDVQTPTEKQMMQRERAKKNREKSRKSRETQRNKKDRE